MCTQLPKFEKDARASVLDDAATLVALAALDGDELHAFALEFPAATARNTPADARLFAEVFTAEENPPPSDMLATAGLMWFVRTQSMPAITPEFVPEPLQLSTRTARNLMDFATPYFVPPTVPAT